MIRGILRDFLTLYVCISILLSTFSGNFKADGIFILATLLLLLLTVWFILEKFGFLPKFM